MTQQKPNPSAAADKPLSKKLEQIREAIFVWDKWLDKLNDAINEAKNLDAQQTDDALSRNNDGIPDIIAHGIMEEVRMQTTQVSTPEEPNYSSDPYYDAECKISEIIAKHRATTGTLSELRTQIEAEIDLNKSVLRTDYVIAWVDALYWVLSRMTQLDSAQTAKKKEPK